MTFLEAYALHGPDLELIGETIGVTPPEADRLINAKRIASISGHQS
ncbi:hypothetical protein FHX06_007221 [Rhizobium sp. BK512]|nr:hypothetical protein [Rhizobium sp. BK512]MBB3565848.1 hypothetical protein [Rhizobium sp. BK512]